MAAFSSAIARIRRLTAHAGAYRIGPSLPGLAGMALLSLGAAWIFLPAGLIAGGALLLLVDRRL